MIERLISCYALISFSIIYVDALCVAVKGKNASNSGESRVFWLSLVVAEVFWVVFVFAALITLSFKWFVSISFVACVIHLIDN